MPLTWIAPGSPYPPDYGEKWLSLFNGGLLTTCGLGHAGQPEDDRDLHGDYTRLRSGPVSTTLDGQTLSLSAAVHESTLFGPQFRLTRTYSLTLGKAEIRVHDEVENIGDQPSPFMLMYHCNPGYPLVREGTELLVASDIYAYNAESQADGNNWNRYAAPKAGFVEQVYLHHPRTSPGVNSAFALAALVNDDIGLQWAWDTRHMPYLTQWKNTRQGIYVCGIEPGNCIPEGQNGARDAGRLVMLQPGEQHTFELALTILDGPEAIQSCRDNIERLKTDGLPTEGCDLTGYSRIEAQA
jgi:galactose mutarotase-like enzyme